jgi:hypothetical protein
MRGADGCAGPDGRAFVLREHRPSRWIMASALVTAGAAALAPG